MKGDSILGWLVLAFLFVAVANLKSCSGDPSDCGSATWPGEIC